MLWEYKHFLLIIFGLGVFLALQFSALQGNIPTLLFWLFRSTGFGPTDQTLRNHEFTCLASQPSPTKNEASRSETATGALTLATTASDVISVFGRDSDGTNSFADALKTLEVDVECWSKSDVLSDLFDAWGKSDDASSDSLTGNKISGGDSDFV